MNSDELRALQRKAIEIRRVTLDEIAHLGVGHVGGSMSVVEVLVLLYYKVLKVDPTNPTWEERDKFVMSKGHAGPSLYAILADRGFFDRAWLHTLNVGGTNLPSHCDRIRTPGIDMSTGSLGQGLSVAVGMALGHRMQGLPGRVYALVGDGDTNEGQTWEAAMSAGMFGLSNLVAFTDYNKMQIDGPSDDIMSLADLAGRWQTFGWDVQQVDGHDLAAIDKAVTTAVATQNARPRPAMIILETVKGKGISFAEGDYKNHNMPVSADQAAEADRILAAQLEAIDAQGVAT